jgi:(heptosyl)LPS beta-1,4-glucosyltransferase
MLSAIVITKNESQMIEGCLQSLKFADEIIVVDTGNTDDTNIKAKKYAARIVKSRGIDYSQFRNDGLKAASGDWILYVDADERISPDFFEEFKSLKPGVYQIPRTNIFLGRQMHHGGWENDKVIRLFYKKYLLRYIGELHEQPEFSVPLQTTKSFLTHYSHRDLSSMLEKTLQFTAYEAQLRFDAHHPPVVWWRFLRVMATEFFNRFIIHRAFLDGPEGVIDGLFQVFNTFIIYARLWEMQIQSK